MNPLEAQACLIWPTPGLCHAALGLLADAAHDSWQVLLQYLDLLGDWWPLAVALLLGLVITVVLMSPVAKARAGLQVKILLAPFFWPGKLLGSILLLGTGLLPLVEPTMLWGEMLLVTLLFHGIWATWLLWRQPVLRPLVGVLGLNQLFLSLLMMAALQSVAS